MPSFDNPIWKWTPKATNDHRLFIKIFLICRLGPNYFVIEIFQKTVGVACISPISQGQ